jgi:hypothetical protein
MENHKRVTGYLKTTANWKDDRVNQELVCRSSQDSRSSSPLGEGKQGLYLKVNQTDRPSSGTITTPPENSKTSAGIWQDSNFPCATGQQQIRQPFIPIPQKDVARCHLEGGSMSLRYSGIFKTRSNHNLGILRQQASESCWLAMSWEVKGSFRWLQLIAWGKLLKQST